MTGEFIRHFWEKDEVSDSWRGRLGQPDPILEDLYDMRRGWVYRLTAFKREGSQTTWAPRQQGLPREWDKDTDLRDTQREGGRMFPKERAGTVWDRKWRWGPENIS